MEKKLNLSQKIKPIEALIKKAKHNISTIKFRGYQERQPFYWENKLKQYEAEIEEIIKNHNK